MKVKILNREALHHVTNSEELMSYVKEQLEVCFREAPTLKTVPVETYYDERIFYFGLISFNEYEVEYRFMYAK